MALTKRFVCLDCGARFEIHRWLEAHWFALGHGPKAQAISAITRAKQVLAEYEAELWLRDE